MHAIGCHKMSPGNLVGFKLYTQYAWVKKQHFVYILNMFLTFRTLLTQGMHNLYANPSAGTHLIFQCIYSFLLMIAE